MPLALAVHPADIQDRDGLALVCRRIRRRFAWLRLLFADGGYQGEIAACAAAEEGLRLEIVKRPAEAEGFEVLPRPSAGACRPLLRSRSLRWLGWVIERSFAWLTRNRRLARDDERLIESATAMVVLAFIQLLAKRLATS